MLNDLFCIPKSCLIRSRPRLLSHKILKNENTRKGARRAAGIKAFRRQREIWNCNDKSQAGLSHSTRWAAETATCKLTHVNNLTSTFFSPKWKLGSLTPCWFYGLAAQGSKEILSSQSVPKIRAAVVTLRAFFFFVYWHIWTRVFHFSRPIKIFPTTKNVGDRGV